MQKITAALQNSNAAETRQSAIYKMLISTTQFLSFDATKFTE